MSNQLILSNEHPSPLPTAIRLNENRFDVHYGVNSDEKTREDTREIDRERGEGVGGGGGGGGDREKREDKTNDPSRIQQYLLR